MVTSLLGSGSDDATISLGPSISQPFSSVERVTTLSNVCEVVWEKSSLMVEQSRQNWPKTINMMKTEKSPPHRVLKVGSPRYIKVMGRPNKS